MIEWAAKALIATWKATMYIWKARCSQNKGETKFKCIEAKERKYIPVLEHLYAQQAYVPQDHHNIFQLKYEEILSWPDKRIKQQITRMQERINNAKL